MGGTLLAGTGVEDFCGDTKTTWFLPLEGLPQCEMDPKSTWIDTREEPSATGVQRREIDFKLSCVRKVPE